ncbi:MAG TPA: hypothetical protein VFM18_04570 [Methanosarcina sp.]|nr:hypothetical protein [Methanosarcina sp.]
MSSRNHLFPGRGSVGEVNLYEDLINESVKMYGQEYYYIPRTLVAVDDVLGEDRLSKFKGAYKFVGYLEEIFSFGGSGGFLQKIGYMVEETGTITVARREWAKAVGQYGATILPNRPCEGDLIWFPLTDALFEIKYVEHQSQMSFYQLGKLYTYKLKVELFTYSSERMDTGIDEVDNYALDATFDLLNQKIDSETGLPIAEEDGTDLAQEKPKDKSMQVFDKTEPLKADAEKILNDIEKNPFADF